ncbi:MAG: PBSX family phage terminase large subunit [Bacteroidales bacterium]|nr:PBSX family phage terminase large subunit [Bacteroidales bacterium]
MVVSDKNIDSNAKIINYNWQYSEIFEPVFNWQGRYIALPGGRSSGKSFFVAHYLLQKLMVDNIDLLCAREHQNSIAESNYKLFTNIIDKYNLPFDVQATKIICKLTGSTIVFVGLSDVTADNIKSYEDFGLVWLEEAQKISKKSWEVLNPTIRREGAQIFITMNPEVPHHRHPIMSELTTIYKEDTLLLHVNYTDNPFVSKDIIKMAEIQKKHKPEEYARIWLGEPDDGSATAVVKYFTDDNIVECEYIDTLPLHLTCDFNVDPMCWYVAHKTKDKIFFVDELVVDNTHTKECIDNFITMYREHKGKIIVNGDASGDYRKTQSAYSDYAIIQRELERAFGYSRVKIDIRRFNPSIKSRIAAWNNMIFDANGNRRLFISPKCKWLMYNCYNLKYKPGTSIVDVPTPAQISKNIDLKYLEHPFDAASYLCEYYFPVYDDNTRSYEYE